MRFSGGAARATHQVYDCPLDIHVQDEISQSQMEENRALAAK